jgi:serine/threonine-protein kinase
MGIVYRAQDRLLNRTVAVKVMRSRFMDRPDLLRRFLAEARIHGKLQHPGVVPVYEVGTLPDTRPFIAMKLIEGQTLALLLRERTTPADNLAHYLKVFETLCQTMAYAHRQGVIHRDLKPENLMVGAFGEVQVMDWGLAKFLNPADAVAPTPDGFEAVEKSAYLSGDGGSQPGSDHLTQAVAIVPVGPDDPTVGYTTAGEVFGTLPYMPPEQARGETDRVDRRSDVFALGAILCQILTGQPPYFGAPETLRDQARGGKLFGAFVLLDRCGADQAVVLLAKHCLAVEPNSRPADAGVLAAMMTQCLEGLQDRTRQLEMSRLAADARVAEAEAREKLARKARRLARSLAVVSVMVAALLAAWIGWYTRHAVVVASDESARHELAVHQVEAALAAADARHQEARTAPGGPLVRAAAARQALADCQRAESLLEKTSEPPTGLRERLWNLKGQVTHTQLGIDLIIALDDCRRELLDTREYIDREAAAARSRELFAAKGLDLAQVSEDVREYPGFRAALADWLAVSPDEGERNSIAHALESLPGGPSPAWLQAVSRSDPDRLVKVADSPSEAPIPVVSFALVAERLFKDGKPAEAERLLTRGVRQHPQNFTLNVRLATALRANGKSANAIRYLTAAHAARPDYPAVNYALGLALADANRTDEAIETLRAVVQTYRKDATFHAKLGDLYLAQGNADAARDSFSEALAVEPANGTACIGLARAELGRGDLDAAAKAFQTAAKSPAHAAAAHAGLGKIHRQRWEAAKAVAEYRSAVAAEPTNLDHHLGLVDALKVANDLPGALREAQATAGAFPKAAAAHRWVGDLLLAAGDPAGAVTAYRATVQCDPADPDTHWRLAAALGGKDDWTAAAGEYQAVVELRPKDVKAHLAVARARQKAGDLAGAADAFRRALALDADDATVRQELGRCLAARGDDGAIDELKAAVEAAPESGDARATLGEALARLGRFREAAAALRQAAEKYTGDSAKRDAARTAARTATRMAALEDRLPQLLAGAVTMSTPASWAEVGEVCRRTCRYAAAARFYAEAADGDAKYAGPAATCAALAGFGRGADATDTSEEARAEWRQAALAGLKKVPEVAKDPALAGLREVATMESLPAEERQAWKAVWDGR